jgi:hypothetical protein
MRGTLPTGTRKQLREPFALGLAPYVRPRIVSRVPRTIAAVLAVAALVAAGCGAAAPPPDREWIANARGVVQQLHGDVVAVSAYDRVGTAREGLRDESQLYGLLVAYTDFGGCRHMAAAVGTEPPSLSGVVRALRRACLHLQRADGLFTRAVAHHAPPLLAAATREALVAVPSLDAAALELARRA